MTNSNARRADEPAEPKIPRRDWLILPLISLATIACILSVAEVSLRALWPDSETDSCRVSEGPNGGYYRSNCRSMVKAAEGPWVENIYNGCGYRTLEACGPKPQGTLRVAVLGSSVAYGYLVPYNSAYTTLAAEGLTRACRRHVEFQNVATAAVPLNDVYLRANEALALKPDLLLLTIDPFDVSIFNHFDPNAVQSVPASSQEKKGLERVRSEIVGFLKSSRAALVLQHFMYQNPSTYAKLYLMDGDNAGYLQSHFSPSWQERLTNLDTLLRSLSGKAKSASVPLTLLIWPSAAQVALENSPPRPGVEADALQKAIAAMAAKYGIPVINPLPGFADRPDVMQMYYVVNGHANARGQRVVGDAVIKALIDDDRPVFAGCSRR